MMPLFTGVGLMMQHTTVEAFKPKRSGLSVYSGLIAHPSTGKSPAAELIVDALNKVESALEIKIDKSHFTQPATIEALLEHLNSQPCMMCK
jgi:hypothetical protein